MGENHVIPVTAVAKHLVQGVNAECPGRHYFIFCMGMQRAMFPSTNGIFFWPGFSPVMHGSVAPRLGLADSQELLQS